jgi:energy-coupling factor transporter transmembrane protein EcfT
VAIIIFILVVVGLGFAFWAYWPYILAFFVIGTLLVMFTDWATGAPAEMHNLVGVKHTVVTEGDASSTDRYRHLIQFSIRNDTPNYSITDLHFNCEGGRSKTHPASIRPGQELTDTLRVGWAESLENCVPIYDLEELY